LHAAPKRKYTFVFPIVAGTNPDRLCDSFANNLKNGCTKMGLDPGAATAALRANKGGAAVDMQLLVEALRVNDAAAYSIMGTVKGSTLQIWVDAPGTADPCSSIQVYFVPHVDTLLPCRMLSLYCHLLQLQVPQATAAVQPPAARAGAAAIQRQCGALSTGCRVSFPGARSPT
jgi:hypothetical protein